MPHSPETNIFYIYKKKIEEELRGIHEKKEHIYCIGKKNALGTFASANDREYKCVIISLLRRIEKKRVLYLLNFLYILCQRLRCSSYFTAKSLSWVFFRAQSRTRGFFGRKLLLRSEKKRDYSEMQITSPEKNEL